jgi:cell division protein FtsW
MSTVADPSSVGPVSVTSSSGLEARAHGRWDWWLIVTTALLVGFGLLMMLSSSSLMADATYGNALHFVIRQAVGMIMGALGGVVVLLMPWKPLRRLSWWAWIGTIVLLALVFTPLGNEANGSYRWISLGPINIQPSEYAKVALILVLANYLAANEGRLHDVVGTLVPAIALPVPILLLVIVEPDFGSTVVLSAIVGLMLFLAGLAWRWVIGGGALGVALLAFVAVLEPYRMRRLSSFLDPFADPEGSGYQVVQGWIALASGGLWGQGLASGVAQRGFLPEAHTDFISAVVGEELGAVGFVALVGLYLMLLWRGTHIATRAPDLFGNLVAMGCTALLGMQAVINLGVVVGWLPAKGLVLPFMSYGASAVTVHVLCIALLLRVGLEGDVMARNAKES